jgi:hypothetical protein
MKICSVCNTEKELTEYYTQKKKRKDGSEWVYYNPECKECTKNRSRKWAVNNPEKSLEIRVNSALKFKRENKERVRITEQARRDRGTMKKWQQNNKDKMKQYAFYRTMHKTHEISPEEKLSVKEYFDFECAYCGISEIEAKEKYNNNLHMDHVDPNGANDLSNNIPACKSCNGRKNTYSLVEWFQKNDVGFNIDRLNKIYKWLDEDYKLYILQ